jgi:hypothetical protein
LHNGTRQAIKKLADQCVREVILEVTSPMTAALDKALGRALISLTRDGSPAVPAERDLTNVGEYEFVRYGFRFRGRVQFTGRTTGRKGNVVMIGQAEVILPDAEFKRLLFLGVGLFESPDGFVDIGKDHAENDHGECEICKFFPDGVDQAVSRLRQRLPQAVTGLSATDFIEVQRRRIRISTHRDCLSFDRQLLLRHPDESVKRLIARLPDA